MRHGGINDKDRLLITKEEYKRIQSKISRLETEVRIFKGFVKNCLDDIFSKFRAQKDILEYKLYRTYDWNEKLVNRYIELCDGLKRIKKKIEFEKHWEWVRKEVYWSAIPDNWDEYLFEYFLKH